MAGISPKLPLVVSAKDGVFDLIVDTEEALLQDLYMVIFTEPGEKMMQPTFGVGLKKFLFEPATPFVYENISSEIYTQVARYLPRIKIQNIRFNEAQGSPQGPDLTVDSALTSITLEYSITPLVKINSLVIPIP
jgi:phage baseplate assembly protein W|tara:strand:- start:135 stop:536 length:402 start_codon:yes stop_codon:yes gene_type:complete